MQHDKIKFIGEVTIRRYNESTGETLEEKTIPNLVVGSGLEWIAGRMAGTQTAMSHMAVGSDNTAALGNQLTLGNEITRVALVSTTPNANSVTYIASFPAGVGTGALTEAAILNAAANGTMLCRTVFPVVNKGVGDAISITWVITAAATA